MILQVASFFLLVSFSSTNAYVMVEEECLNYTVYPVQYELELVPQFIYTDRKHHFNCEISITVIANAPNVQKFELDAKELEIDTNKIQVLDKHNIDIIDIYGPIEYDSDRGKLSIVLTQPMVHYSISRDQYVIKIPFGKYMSTDGTGTGIYVLPYVENRKKKYFYVTRLSPDKAKYFFPCFENPHFEAVFKLRVYEAPFSSELKPLHGTLFISKEQRKERVASNYTFIEFMPSPQISLYQVAFHQSQFMFRPIVASNNDTILIWLPPSKLEQCKYMYKVTKIMMDMIIEYSTVKRSLVDGYINIVGLPQIVDGYEIASWNILTIGENRLLHSHTYTSVIQEEQMTFELAHQLCRIWLGNPGEPGRTRWYEPWFKEGLATYLAYHFLTQFQHGAYSLVNKVPLTWHGMNMKHKAMAEDSHSRTSTPALKSFNRTLIVDITKYKKLVQMKTASLLWMVESWFGSDRFHNALVKYINLRRGNYLSFGDFLSYLDVDMMGCLHQFLIGSTTTKIMNSWFDQPSYPVIVVFVLKDRTPNAIQLKQHKFSLFVENHDSHYLIPISYLLQYNKTCLNCNAPTFTINSTYAFMENLNNGWIILNVNASGYYRVNYDEHNWKLIAKSLKEERDSIPELNRAQIVNDVFALYAAGEMNQALSTEILDYLVQETSPIVWDSVINGFEYLKIQGARCSMNKFLFKEWEEYMLGKVMPIYLKLTENFVHDRESRILRTNIVRFTCGLHLTRCSDSLKNFFLEYMQGRHSLDPDTRATSYKVHYETDASFADKQFNIFELEDKLQAEREILAEQQFMHYTPLGTPEMGHLMMSSTPKPLITPTSASNGYQPITPGKQSGDAASNFASVVVIITCLLINILR